MTKFAVAVLLIFCLFPSAFAITCKEIFQPAHAFYRQSTYVQINLLDTAEFTLLHPDHKFVNSDWSRFAIQRYRISEKVVSVDAQNIATLKNSAVRNYTMNIRDVFMANFDPRIPHRQNETYLPIEAPKITLTLIFDSTQKILAAKINYSVRVAKKADLDQQAAGLLPLQAFQHGLLSIQKWNAEGYFDARGEIIQIDTHL